MTCKWIIEHRFHIRSDQAILPVGIVMAVAFLNFQYTVSIDISQIFIPHDVRIW
jgi:hypothetical protein